MFKCINGRYHQHKNLLRIGKRLQSVINAHKNASISVSKLKYNPRQESSFTGFGILPFLQDRLNELKNHNNEHTNERFSKLGTIPRDSSRDILASADQRSILSILGSDHSVLHRGEPYSGKSMAIAAFALNLLLRRVPKYGPIKSIYSVDSVILVPTGDDITKYWQHFSFLIEKLPIDCCPDQLEKDGESFNVTRRPLSIQFLFNDLRSILQTGSNNNVPPQILVTTAGRFHELLNEEENSTIDSSNYKETQFLAIDNVTYMLETTDLVIPENVNIVQHGAKRRYRNILSLIVNRLQTIQMDYYRDSLQRRLKSAEFKDKRELEKRKNDKFNYTEWTLSYSGSSLNVEKLLRAISGKPDGNLLKKMVKIKRKFLFKPLQFCFVLNASNQQSVPLETFANREIAANIQLEQIRQLSQRVATKKALKADTRATDNQRSFFERLVHFSDAQRNIRKQERSLVVVGGRHITNEQKKIVFSVCDGEENTIRNIDIGTNWPVENYQSTLASSILSQNKQKSMLQNFLRTLKKTYQLCQFEKIITKACRIKNLNPKSCIVVPPYISLQELKAKLLANSIDCQVGLNEERFTSNSLIHPHHLLSCRACPEHLLILGIECLFSQLALCSWTDISTALVPGIENPYADLWSLYNYTLGQGTEIEVILLDKAHLSHLSRIVLHNKIVNSEGDGHLKLHYNLA